MRIGRWILILVVVVVALVLAGAVTVRLLYPPERVRAEVVARAEEATGFDIELEDARLGLTRRGLAITLTGVGLRNPARVAEDPILRLSRLDLAVALRPLLKREIQVNHLALDEPQIFLYRDAAGNLNATVERAPEAPATAEPAPSGPGVLLAVPAAEIRDGSLRYVDEAAKSSFEIADLDGELRVAIEPDTLRLKTDLELAGVAADMSGGGGAAYGPLDLALRGEVAHAPEAGRTVIRDLVLALQAIEIMVTGTIAAAPAEDAPPVLDLALATGSFEPSRVLSLLPGALPPGLEVAGRAELSATVKGAATKPEIAGSLIVDRVDVTPPDQPGPLLTGLSGEARFTQNSLAVRGLRGQLAGSPFTASLSLRDFVRPAVEGGLELSARVVDLRRLAPMPAEGGMVLESGEIAVDVDFKTKAPDFAGALELEGEARGQGIGARLPGLAVPVKDLEFTAAMAGRRVTVEPFRVVLGSSDLGGRVALSSLDPPSVSFALKSRHFDLDELLGEQGAAAGPEESAAKEPAREGPPPAVAARGSVRADELVLRGLNARDASLELILDRDGLRIENLRASLLGGDLAGGASVSFADPDSLRYASNLKVTGLDANEVLSATTPARNLIYGKLDADLDLSGVRAGETPIAQLLSAVGNATVVDGYLAASGPLAAILGQMGLLPSGTERLDVRRIVAAFEVDRGRVRFRDTVIGSAHSGEFTLSGSVGLDGSLEYAVTGLLPQRYAPKELTDRPELLSLVTDDSGRIPVDFSIGGTVKDPRVKLDLAKLEQRAAGRAKEELKERADEELKKGLDDVGRRVGDLFKKK
jgi:AsmA protein